MLQQRNFQFKVALSEQTVLRSANRCHLILILCIMHFSLMYNRNNTQGLHQVMYSRGGIVFYPNYQNLLDLVSEKVLICTPDITWSLLNMKYAFLETLLSPWFDAQHRVMSVMCKAHLFLHDTVMAAAFGHLKCSFCLWRLSFFVCLPSSTVFKVPI